MKKPFPWYDDKRSFEERVELLIKAMTPEEKIGQMVHSSKAVERLGIPEYNWWNEALHGVARAGLATVFPQAIGLAATFDEKLIFRVAGAIADEGRAKYHAALKNNNRGQYFGLTYWSPNINIFRDPRWGRGQETYGEDPYLTARLGVQFVRGLQGDDPKYLKAAACAKHFIVHSGPENLRHSFNAKVSARDFFTTYAPAFKALVTEAKVESVMGAYNKTNGELCCGSKKYIGKLLRDQWGFQGHFVSDCGAIRDFHTHHKVAADPASASAYAVKNGCDINCGCSYDKLTEALDRKLIAEKEIDTALRRVLMTRMKLGMFDSDTKVPFSKIPENVVGSRKHRKLALEAARKSVVLLENNGILPLKKNMRSLGLSGPNLHSIDALTGNYNGWSKNFTTIVEGIVNKVSPGTQVDVQFGCGMLDGDINTIMLGCMNWSDPEAVILALGLNGCIEGEEGSTIGGGGGGDRQGLELPAGQLKLVDYFYAKKIPIIALVMSGSPLDLRELRKKAAAIVQLWYPGEAGGEAAADVLFGDCNPAGRLPITFPMSTKDLPDITDYNMENGRTYRYAKKKPLYEFGYGLSYTEFEYKQIKLKKKSIRQGECAAVSAEVINTGNYDGDEVVQCYIRHTASPVPTFLHTLAGFKRVRLKKGETKKVSFHITPEQLSLCSDTGEFFQAPGKVEISIGGGQMHKTGKKAVLEVV